MNLGESRYDRLEEKGYGISLEKGLNKGVLVKPSGVWFGELVEVRLESSVCGVFCGEIFG